VRSSPRSNSSIRHPTILILDRQSSLHCLQASRSRKTPYKILAACWMTCRARYVPQTRLLVVRYSPEILTHTQARAQISGVQDWRDNAAVVFTIITVIFLPLSFVASVFGMNTTDIRNMALTQWVFWLSACSFTVVVVLITVYFVDVPPLWRWLERKGDAKSGNAAPPRPAQHSKDQFFVKLARQIEDKAAADSVNHGHAAKGDGSVTNDERESVGSFEDEA
jgi:uncharacterized membrane protein